MRTFFKLWLPLTALVVSSSSFAAISSADRHDAAKTRTGQYQTKGFFAGGSKSITSAKLSELKRGKFGEGERVVLVLDSLSDAAVGVPYFEVKSVPQEGRMVLSIWADVLYEFDKAKVRKAFEKSPNIKRLNVLPRVEDGLTVIEFMLNPTRAENPVRFEAFTLTNPARIVVDVL